MRSCVLLALLAVLLALAAPARAQSPDIPKPNPRVPAGAWAPLLKAHPRLLGPKADLQARAKAQPDLYKLFKADRELLLAAGLVHAVEGAAPDRLAPWLELARRNLARGATNVHQDTWIWMEQVVLVYDLFHDQLAPGERAKMIQWLNANLVSFTADESAFHNSTLSKIFCYLCIAYGTWGENPRAKEFRDHALVKLYEGRVLPVLQAFGAGGGYTECGWYTRGSLWHLVQALELVRRFEGYDGFAKAPRFFYQRLAYELLQAYPGKSEYRAERYPVEGDGVNTYGGHVEYPRHTRDLLARYYRGAELARYTHSIRRRGSNPAAALVDFLSDEPVAPGDALPIAAFPLAHHAAGIGRVYARSDWTDAATWFRFECGDFWNHHQHFEAGNFEIYRHEPLATESGEYTDYANPHAVNWLMRTIAHNCILVHQPDEQWKMLRDGGRQPYANDGGQDVKWDWVKPDLASWQKQGRQFERGDIVAYENRPEFLYVAGDCTAAYAPTKLKSLVRQIVFLRPGTFVVFDRVVSTRPEYEKTWLLHCTQEPQLQDRTATITHGKGKLVVQTLLPEKPTLRKVEGYTYRGQTFDPPKSALTPLAHRWRIEVLPGAPAAEDLFLHVLTTVDSPPAQLVRQGGAVGVRVGPAQVVFTGKAGGTLMLAGRATPLEPKVKPGRYE